MSQPIDSVLPRLDKVRRQGAGWMALCPAHNDSTQSLKVDEGTDKRVLLKCFAGCSTQEIVAAAGLSIADLFPRVGNKDKSMNNGPSVVYNYKDEAGHLLFQVCRYNLDDGKKTFKQRRPNGGGQWHWGLQGVRRVLYRLPDILASPDAPVFICEGEKDVDALIAGGLVATTNPQGAGKWRAEYSDALRDRHCVIIPDNDEPGLKHAAEVARSLMRKSASLRVIFLPDLQPKGDVSDWLQSGHSPSELWDLGTECPDLKTLDDQGAHTMSNERLRLFMSILGEDAHSMEYSGRIVLATVKPELVDWLWGGRIPYGKLTIVDGDPGLGKSTMLLDIAARLTTGTPMPAEPHRPTKAGVLLLSAEDGIADTIVPRLIAAGADLSRIEARQTVTDARGLVRLPEIPTDLPTLAMDIEELGAKLVIVDPLVAYLAADHSARNDQDVRRALAPFAELAQKTGAAVVALRHLNKAFGGNAIYRGGGSIGIIGAARSGLVVAKDPDDPAGYRHILASQKCNLAPPPSALAYHMESAENGVGRIVWEGETEHTANGLLAGPQDNAEKPALNEATRFLKKLLEDGPKAVTEIKREARAAGISDITLRRAKSMLGAEAQKTSFGEGGFWVWDLPAPNEHLSLRRSPNAEDAHCSLYEQDSDQVSEEFED